MAEPRRKNPEPDAAAKRLARPRSASPEGQLLTAFRDAVGRSRTMGRAVSFVVDVGPQGVPTITPVEDGPKAPGSSRSQSERDRKLARALDAARARGRGRVAEILGGPDMLSGDDFAQLIGTTRATVNVRRQNHQVLGLQGATRGFRFPAWQVDDEGKPFTALPELFDVLGGSPWAVYRFLVQHHPELDGLTGAEALRQGRSHDVVDAAAGTAQAFS